MLDRNPYEPPRAPVSAPDPSINIEAPPMQRPSTIDLAFWLLILRRSRTAGPPHSGPADLRVHCRVHAGLPDHLRLPLPGGKELGSHRVPRLLLARRDRHRNSHRDVCTTRRAHLSLHVRQHCLPRLCRLVDFPSAGKYLVPAAHIGSGPGHWAHAQLPQNRLPRSGPSRPTGSGRLPSPEELRHPVDKSPPGVALS